MTAKSLQFAPDQRKQTLVFRSEGRSLLAFLTIAGSLTDHTGTDILGAGRMLRGAHRWF